MRLDIYSLQYGELSPQLQRITRELLPNLECLFLFTLLIVNVSAPRAVGAHAFLTVEVFAQLCLLLRMSFFRLEIALAMCECAVLLPSTTGSSQPLVTEFCFPLRGFDWP